MKFAMYVFYWTVVGPILFLVAMDIFIYPAILIARAIWGETLPILIEFGIGGVALVALVIACCVVWAVWCRFQNFVLIHLGTSRTA